MLYLFQGFALKLVADKPVLRPCDRIKFRIRRTPERLGAGALKQAPDWYSIGVYAAEPCEKKFVQIHGRRYLYDDEFQYSSSPAMIFGALSDVYGLHEFSDFNADNPGESFGIILDRDDAASIKEGAHTVELPLILNGEWTKGNAIWLSHGKPPPQRRVTLSCPLMIAPSPAISHDASLEPQIRAAVQFESMRTSKDHRTPPGWAMAVQLRCLHPPIDLAYKLSINTPGSHSGFSGGEFYVPAGSDKQITVFSPAEVGSSWGFGGPPPEVVDLELRPEPSASPMGTRKVWGEALTIKGVRVNGAGK